MRTPSKTSRLRRTLALTTAAIALAGGVTLSATGTAQADASRCGTVDQGGTSQWYNWKLTPCMWVATGGTTYYSNVYVRGGTTDVRVYTGVYDSCNGVTYGLNGDSAANHVYPGQSVWVRSNDVSNIHCANGLWGIARVFSNGVGSPWAWSNGIGAS